MKGFPGIRLHPITTHNIYTHTHHVSDYHMYTHTSPTSHTHTHNPPSHTHHTHSYSWRKHTFHTRISHTHIHTHTHESRRKGHKKDRPASYLWRKPREQLAWGAGTGQDRNQAEKAPLCEQRSQLLSKRSFWEQKEDSHLCACVKTLQDLHFLWSSKQPSEVSGTGIYRPFHRRGNWGLEGPCFILKQFTNIRTRARIWVFWFLFKVIHSTNIYWDPTLGLALSCGFVLTPGYRSFLSSSSLSMLA